MTGLLGAALSSAWKITKERIFFLIPLVLVYYIVILLPEILNGTLKLILHAPELQTSLNFSNLNMGLYTSFMRLASLCLSALAGMGFLSIALSMLDGKKDWKISDIKYFFSQWTLIPASIMTLALYMLMVSVGLIFFIVPGIIVVFVFSLWQFFLVDKKLGPIASLKASMVATRGMRWALFLYMLYFVVFNAIGLLIFFVGSFVTIPVTIIAMAYIYRHLSVRVEQLVPNPIASKPPQSRNKGRVA